ncbi:MAG: hypothetical protein ACYC26_07305 [Phycisphaerales bacterium]
MEPEMPAEKIRTQHEALSAEFNKSCGPGGAVRGFSGSLTVEMLRAEFVRNGIAVSPRNVFVRGIRCECDLLVVKPLARPQHEMLYEPEDVLAILEIKNRGIISNGTAELDKLRGRFSAIVAKYPQIKCAYITLKESASYKNRVSDENLKPHKSFTLFFSCGSQTSSSDRFEDLIAFLKNLSAASE